jgi:hypothetical protein
MSRTRRRYVRMTGTVEQRFWARVRKSDGCWEWTGACFKCGGYGQFTIEHGQQVRAHRHSWELHNGPIPKGLWVLHRCDNPKCVRPDHLFLGTCTDNARDMMAKGRGRGQYVRKTHCHRGHALVEPNLIHRPTGYSDCRQCSRITGRVRDRIRRGYKTVRKP